MLKNILKAILAAALSACALVAVALVVWWRIRGSGVSFQDTLFWVGALPMALFTLGSMGRFAGRGDFSYQMSRSISEANPDQKTEALIHDLRSLGKSGLNWVLAGLMLWAGSWGISYFTRH